MYTTCIYCHKPLGSNQAVEAFPVGRKLAFDGAKGRLWVVCGKCSRWNLSPLETRWEAIEECQRLFHDARLRVSTENIGLAKLRDGTELVRIGEPLRPEFAAWRYGQQFRRRFRNRAQGLAMGGAFIAAWHFLTPAAVGGVVIMQGASAIYRAVQLVRGSPTRPGETEVIAQVRDDAGTLYSVWGTHVPGIKLTAAEDTPSGWSLDVPHRGGKTRFTGQPATLVLGHALSHLNSLGGSARRVERAVGLIEEAGAGDRFFAAAERKARRPDGFSGALLEMGPELRLALEMAAHEENERRAMEGELALLEWAWRDAEVIAGIADRLAVSPGPEGDVPRRVSGG